MSFFADNKTRPHLAVDAATGLEPPSKRLRSLLGAEPALGEVGHRVSTALGLAGAAGLDPLSVAAAHGRALPETFLLGTSARSLLLRAVLDEQMLAASGLSSSLGPLGSLGALGSVASFGSLGLPSTATSFIERNLDASQVLSLKDLSALQGNPLASVAGIPPSLPNARTKTKLCKHFIENRCRFYHLCNFAHSIEELKKMPDEGDQEGKTLLERYKAKVEAEKQMVGQNFSAVPIIPELKTKLCKHFIDGECRFMDGCHFAHSIKELKRMPEKGDVAGEALLERYRAKEGSTKITSSSVPAQEVTKAKVPASTSTVAKTKLCKHFIVDDCKFKESCTFAHSIEELKSLPGDGDDAEKALLEQYRSKMETKILNQDETKEKETLMADTIVKAEMEEGSEHAQATCKLETSTMDTQAKVDDKSMRFLKTKMCKHFIIGACKYGANCTFAHSIEELKPPADEDDVTVKTKAVVATPSPMGNAKIAAGSTGEQTTQTILVSQQADVKQDDDLNPKKNDAKQNEDPNAKKDDKEGVPKSKICKFFSEGTCRFGIACAFIHDGQVQGNNSNGSASQSGALLGPGDIKPSYKTRLCNMWEKDKTCSFGIKCHFAHGVEEMRNRAGPSVPASNSLMHSPLGLEALSRAWQLGLSSSLPYSYDITDTNWRPFRATEDGIHGLGGGLGVNERFIDAGAAEALHLRGLLQNYGQLEQASSLASLSSLGGANVGLTSNILGNNPSWPMR